MDEIATGKDGRGRIWHVSERADGSISIYYTRAGRLGQYVVWDMRDNAFGVETCRTADALLHPSEWG